MQLGFTCTSLYTSTGWAASPEATSLLPLPGVATGVPGWLIFSFTPFCTGSKSACMKALALSRHHLYFLYTSTGWAASPEATSLLPLPDVATGVPGLLSLPLPAAWAETAALMAPGASGCLSPAADALSPAGAGSQLPEQKGCCLLIALDGAQYVLRHINLLNFGDKP